MQKTKNIFQKISLVIGITSFLLATGCAIGLYLKVQTHSINDPITVAFLVSTFFFICVGGVLMFITNANIPNFNMQIEVSNKD